MESRSIIDIYSCPHCNSIAARGDHHCRGCGIKFNQKDIETMQNIIRSPIAAVTWNTRDRFRCVHCEKFIAISDAYCRGCGDEIVDHERRLMRIRLPELAKQNTPALIGLALFVLFVIYAYVQFVK